jgi:hypothetical protein
MIAPVFPRRSQVREDDPIWSTLLAYQARIEAGYEEEKQIQPEFLGWSSVESPEVASLFPGLRFASLTWNERARPGVHQVGLAWGLSQTIAVDDLGRVVAILDHFGNYEAFGELLAVHRVRIRDRGDAEVVWSAFNALHAKQWQAGPVQLSATLWLLHDATIEGIRYYFELVLDGNEVVVSARLRSERDGTRG